MSEEARFRSTTIVAVRRDGRSAMAGDGQVSLGNTVMKANARKVRRIAGGRAIAGFAGASADAFTLLERFEARLEALRAGDARSALARAAVELAKDWRTDRFLRKLEAMLIVMDAHTMLLVSGTGDVIEPDEVKGGAILTIGSGGPYALAAGRVLLAHTTLDAAAVAREALRTAADICVYTNGEILVEELGA